MKLNSFIFLLIVSFQLVAQQNFSIKIENKSKLARKDEPIILSRSFLESKIGKIGEGRYPFLKTKEGKNVSTQADDLNGDKIWDELSLVLDIDSNTSTIINITLASSDKPIGFKPRTHARIGKIDLQTKNYIYNKEEVLTVKSFETAFDTASKKHIYQADGPAWENDKVAFRLYFDARFSKDIFGKVQPDLVMDKVGAKGYDYATLTGWGMDILKVGQSLGAGSIAFEIPNSASGTDLVRVSGKTDKTTCKIISDGPVRTIVKFEYFGWDINGKKYDVTETVTIWAGQYWYENKVTINGATPINTLTTGIANKYGMELNSFPSENAQIIASYGKQSENHDLLGMAVLVNKKDFIEAKQSPNEGAAITHAQIVKLNLNPNSASNYRFYACWELSDKRFTDKESFLTFLKSESYKFSYPLVIK